MTIELIPLDEVLCNPWQPRTADDPAHVARLSADMLAHDDPQSPQRGMLQVPLGRRNGAGVQLAFGHSRLAAWKIAFPGIAFPVDVHSLTDRQMSDLAASENGQRKNLSAIEIAQAIQRRMKDFGLTQLEAARPFGYESQGAVSNLLRLLQLPESIKAKVQSGDIAESLARRLLPVARIAPEQVAQIADKAMAEEPGVSREKAMLQSFEEVLRKKGQRLGGVMWDLSWPKEPVSAVALYKPDKGEPKEVPACRGCEFFVEANYDQWCTRPACLALKYRVFAAHELVRVSQASGIAVAGKGEAVHRLDGDYKTQDLAKRAFRLKGARDGLRLIGLDPTVHHWDTKEVTGSELVGIGTVDLDALRKACKPKADPKKTKGPDWKRDAAADDEDDEDRGLSQSALDEKRRNEEAKRQRAGRRELAESARILAAATKVLASTLPDGTLLDLLANVANWPDDIMGHFGYNTERLYGRKAYLKLPEQEKRHMVIAWLLGSQAEYHAKPDVARTCVEGAARGLHVKMPKAWDSIEATPYLKTDRNCWHCGTEPYTTTSLVDSPTEQARGWLVEYTGADGGSKQATLTRILCPECVKELGASEKAPKTKSAKRSKRS